jgi:hypothetical protein
MEETFKLITRYLKRKRWEYDGTQYVFRTVEWDKSLIVCIVDCILPEKGQSYTKAKFRDSLNNIMANVYDIFDEKMAFSVDFFVDGKEAKSVYLSDNVKRKIRDGLKKVNRFNINGKPPINTKFSCDLKVYPSTKEPSVDDESVNFYYFWDVSNIIFNDIPVKVEESHYADAKGYIDTFMLDYDFSADISDIFYESCEDEFKFGSTDMYISASGHLRKIDGVDNGHGVWWNKDNPTNFFSRREL